MKLKTLRLVQIRFIKDEQISFLLPCRSFEELKERNASCALIPVRLRASLVTKVAGSLETFLLQFPSFHHVTFGSMKNYALNVCFVLCLS